MITEVMTMRMVGIGVMVVVLVMQSLWIGNALVGISGDPWWMWVVFGVGAGMASTSPEKWDKFKESVRQYNGGL